LHPHYDNKAECWDKISRIIGSNKKIKFFIMAMNAFEREDFFGLRPNIVYINQNNQTDFFRDIAEYVKTHTP
jgi:hypothetical protein